MNKKEVVKELLAKQKYKELVKLATKRHSQTLKYIQMHLFGDYDQPLRWYAIEALGKLAKELAAQEPEVYRNLIRRFLWAMNDESGNVPWSSPEAIGSIIVNQPFLYGDLTPMLITNAFDNPMCHRGMLWAIGRIGKIKPSLILPFVPKIIPFLKHEDTELVGYAAWALGEIGYQEAKVGLENLIDKDEWMLTIFQNGRLVKESVGSMARKALEKIEMAS